jgi:hypothetical protein
MYNERIKGLVADENEGRIVAIDVDSGQFELANDTHSAVKSLLSRLPDAQIWCVRIGHEAVRKYGLYGSRPS